MDDIAIRLTNASKRYKLYDNVITGPVLEILTPWRRKSLYTEFWAVKDVTLEIKKGEIVGIVGANGAGKSTLLKMIAGLLPVDRGEIEVNGTITALLALGVGVHPEFTGRENILYTGMLLGMSKEEVQRKMPEIIEFSGLGDYIERPFRTYSSGMRARLLFSASIFIEPDILIVDEALSTGDISFVNKASLKIRELMSSGATILYVSHNLRQIRELCSRCIVMQEGSVIFDGDVNKAIEKYVSTVVETRAISLELANRLPAHIQPDNGTHEVVVTDIYWQIEGARTTTLLIGGTCELCIHYAAIKEIPLAKIMVRFYSEKVSTTYAFVPPFIPSINADGVSDLIHIAEGQGKITLTFSPFTAGDGAYSCDIIIFPGHEGYAFSYDTTFCYYEKMINFQSHYTNIHLFGRGTITEIPVHDLTIETS